MRLRRERKVGGGLVAQGLKLALGIGIAAWLDTRGNFGVTTATTVLVYAIAAMGLGFAFRFANLIDGGHAIYFAAGGYTVVLLASDIPSLPSVTWMLAAGVIGSVLALIVALLVSSLPSLYFTLATMAASILAVAVITGSSTLGGTTGLGALTRGFFDESHPVGLHTVLLIVIIVYAVTGMAVRKFSLSRCSEVVSACRTDSSISNAVGIPAYVTRTRVMALSGFVTGIAGALYALSVQFVDSSLGTVEASLTLLAIVIIAGDAVVFGPAAAACIVIGLPALVSGGTNWTTLLLGGAIVAAVRIYARWTPKSFGTYQWFRWTANVLRMDRGGSSRNVSQPHCRSEGEPSAGGTLAGNGPTSHTGALPTWVGEVSVGLPKVMSTAEILRVEEVRVAYDGLLALDHITLQVSTGAIHALIGPNGAGKSTLIGVMSGHIRPSDGRVLWLGDGDWRPEGTRGGGSGPPVKPGNVSRTFQTPQLVPRLTLRQNVAVGCARWALPSVVGAFLPDGLGDPGRPKVMRVTDELLDALGLAQFGDMYPATTPIGVLRLAEVARALVSGAQLILLDEPAAGLSPTEKETLRSVLMSVREAGVGILVVEHDLEFVDSLADIVTVLDGGRVIAQGSLDQVTRLDVVASAYTGVDLGV